MDGTQFNGPAGLRQALLRYSPQFVRVVTEKLLTYALGRRIDYYDMPTVRAIVPRGGAGQQSFFIARVGDRQERTVSDEREARGETRRLPKLARVSAVKSTKAKEAEPMLMTGKHIPRRTFLRASGVT